MPKFILVHKKKNNHQQKFLNYDCLSPNIESYKQNTLTGTFDPNDMIQDLFIILSNIPSKGISKDPGSRSDFNPFVQLDVI